MDLTHDPSGIGMELAQMIAASPAWERVKNEVRAVLRSDMTQEEFVEACAAALAAAGLGADAMLSSVPEAYAPLLTPESREAIAQTLDLYMAASVLSDLQTGAPLPLISIARGCVRVEEHEIDGAVFSVVHALATPLDDPELMIAAFSEACYRTFDASVFSRRTTNTRDAEWWRRHSEGVKYRTIALDDPRSGLAPEAVLAPKEYADEVRRATDTVRRAVKRFKARWTWKADSLSKESS